MYQNYQECKDVSRVGVRGNKTINWHHFMGYHYIYIIYATYTINTINTLITVNTILDKLFTSWYVWILVIPLDPFSLAKWSTIGVAQGNMQGDI